MEFMNGSAVNFTTPEASTGFTVSVFEFVRLERLEITLLSCHFTFGLLIHSFIIWLIVTGTGNGVASEFFILNLSLSEIFYSLGSLICILERTLTFRFFISFAAFSQGLGVTGHPLFQCLICVERYLAVVHPVTFLKSKPLRYRLICCTAVWIIILGSCLFCSLSKGNMYTMFLSIHLLVLFFIELSCCLAVLRALKQSGPGEKRKDREQENHTKRRAFHLILITTLNMVVMYLPSTIIGLIIVLTKQKIPALCYMSFICFTLAGCVQPVLYLHRTGKVFCFSSPKNSSSTMPFSKCFTGGDN